MKQIGDILSVQKILCECCKKACSFIGRQNKDNVQLLSRINDYLYRKKESVEDILKETEKLRLHVENNPTEIDTFVNWAIVMLGYTVYYNTVYMLEIEDYRGKMMVTSILKAGVLISSGRQPIPVEVLLPKGMKVTRISAGSTGTGIWIWFFPYTKIR